MSMAGVAGRVTSRLDQVQNRHRDSEVIARSRGRREAMDADLETELLHYDRMGNC